MHIIMKIDKINNKIIAELLNNCRQTNIQIGKKVGLSREGVANRIKRLEQENIISGYGLEVDFSKLGFIPHEISIKLQRMNSEIENKIINFLENNDKIVFVEKCLGKFDFILMFMIRSLSELDSEIESLRAIMGYHLKEIDISAWIANYDTMSSLFTEKLFRTISKHSEDEIVYNLDSIEEKLLKELTTNSRESAVNLAKKIGVSPITIANKIKFLYKKGIIKNFRAKINFENLGVHRYSVYLNVSGSKKESALSEFARQHKLIADFTKFAGKYNYSVEIFAKDNEEFKKVVDELLSKFSDSIIDYDALILLNEIKHRPFYL